MVLVVCGAWVVGAQGPPAAAVAEELRIRLVEQINRDRKAAGLAPVQYAAELSAAADTHCREMLAENYSSHWNRAGWKPYMRYAAAGIRDATGENIASFWCSGCAVGAQTLWPLLLDAHQNFMQEQPPHDGHRRSILDPAHTHVGIGVAFSGTGMRLIELFADRYVELEPLPERARLRQNFRVAGRVTAKGYELLSVSVFYEPLPRAMSVAELKATYSYSLPDEERQERPRLHGTTRVYLDGTLGTVEVGAGGVFQVPLTFWKQKPGVYTVAVWIRRGREPALLAAQTSVHVEE
jgi:uncharacterized protein YkwD